MSEIDPITGLPKELGVWESITKESQKIVVSLVRKKFNKVYTSVSGIDTKDVNIKELAKKLKSHFACGGTVKNNNIELQGDHKNKVKRILVESGFPEDTIEVR